MENVKTVEELRQKLDQMYSVRHCYRTNAVWLMFEDAYRRLRKIKNFDGRPLWTSNLAEGEPKKMNKQYGCERTVSAVLPCSLEGKE